MARYLLKVRNLKGYYKGLFGTIRAVDGVSLNVSGGEIVGLAGESGCGKSTFAILCTGTLPPLLHYESGEVLVDGFDVYKTPPEVLRREIKCKRMSYIPQAAMDALNPVKKIGDFLKDVMKERTGKKPSKKELIEMAGEHFERMGLGREVLDRYPHELSGGMRQRAVIGISTLWNPKLLIIDEPTSALDVTTQKKIIKLLADLKRDGIISSMLFISHDLTVLAQICDRCGVMYAGKLVEMGTMEDVVERPLHPYTSALMSSVVSYDPLRSGKGGVKSIPGRPPSLKNPPPGCRFYPRCEKRMDVCKTKEPPLRPVKGRGLVACWLHHG